METNIALIIIFVVAISISYFSYVSKQNKEKQKQENLDNNFLETSLIHIYGNPFLNSSDLIMFQIKENQIKIIKNTETKDVINIFDLISYEIKTHEQIQKDITLSRFLALGIASIAFKKKTIINDMYLYLTYKVNGINIQTLFKNVNNESIGDIISLINKIKILN